MSDQEITKNYMKKMHRDMAAYLHRGEEIRERDVAEVTSTMLEAAQFREEEEDFLTEDQMLVRSELKQMLLIDDDTRNQLMKRKTIPSIVREAEEEKLRLREMANAGTISKVFQGISKEEKANARMRLDKLDRDKNTLLTGRNTHVRGLPSEGKPGQTIRHAQEKSRPDDVKEREMQRALSISRETQTYEQSYEADLQRTLRESLKDSQPNYEESDAEYQQALRESRRVSQPSYHEKESVVPNATQEGVHILTTEEENEAYYERELRNSSNEGLADSDENDADLQQAIRASLKDIQTNDDENDAEYQQAIRASLKDSQTNDDENDADLQQAIRASLKENYANNDDEDEMLQRTLQASLREYETQNQKTRPVQQNSRNANGPAEPTASKEELRQQMARAEETLAHYRNLQKSDPVRYPLMPRDRAEAAYDRNLLTQSVSYDKLSQDQKDQYDFYDECYNAYHSYQTVRDLLQAEEEKTRRTEKEHEVFLSDSLELYYEHQATNNCYCCAGTALFNQLLIHEKDEKTPFVDQYKMRSYVPNFLTKEEFLSLYNVADEATYWFERRDIELFSGAGKTQFGNIYNIGDFFLERRQDIALQRSVFSFRDCSQSRNADTIRHNLIEKFKDTIADVLSKGNALALRKFNHYITITGIKGDSLEVLNSMNKNTVEEVDIYEYFRDAGKVELTWLRKIDDPVELTEEFQNLKYEDGVFKPAARMNSDEDTAHRLGVNVSKEWNEKDSDISYYIQESIYVPRRVKKKA